MSRCQPSGGILKTDVSWEEFEERLRKALSTSATFGPSKRAVEIGEGHVSVVTSFWQSSLISQAS